LRCLQYALQHQPTAATYVDQAESLRALGRRQEALQACEQALALDEQDQSAEQLWMTLQAELDRPAPPASLPMT
jgi:tetratricopeptide (TPR) repeat protein